MWGDARPQVNSPLTPLLSRAGAGLSSFPFLPIFAVALSVALRYPHAMAEHTLNFSMNLPLPRAEVFAFHADAANLGRITPPELDFTILTPLPIVIHKGTLIEYRLQLFGVPFQWISEIREWNPPDGFVDVQKKGPYREWIHRHTFRDSPDGGTIIDDEVRYRLPRLPIGEAAFPLVAMELERIFTFRQEAIRKLLVPTSQLALKKG